MDNDHDLVDFEKHFDEDHKHERGEFFWNLVERLFESLEDAVHKEFPENFFSLGDFLP